MDSLSAMEAEEHRLQAVRTLGLMDTDPERDYDELAQMAAAICEAPMAAVTVIDDKRQFRKARFGPLERETAREASFCKHALHQHDLMEVPDATKDNRFMEHPSVTAQNGVRFYAGMPLTMPDGHVVGTLCVVDNVPRQLTESQRNALAALSHQAVSRMELRLQKLQLEATLAELHRSQKKLEEMNRYLETTALTDALTGLANRRAFDDALRREIARSKRKSTMLSVVMMDIDNFKRRNDRYGHPNGDEVLWQVGEILRTVVRSGDLAARYGGEEFVLLLPETDAAGAKQTCERILHTMHVIEWDKEPVTLSLGVAAMGPTAKTRAGWLSWPTRGCTGPSVPAKTASLWPIAGVRAESRGGTANPVNHPNIADFSGGLPVVSLILARID